MNVATAKKFKLQASQMRDLARGHGACIASDKITVDGEPVRYMFRQKDRETSGWVFTSGLETQAYMDDARNLAVYDVNTIANYDLEIIPFLNAPPGSAFERKGNQGPLVPCEGSEDWKERAVEPGKRWPPPGFPLVEGVHALTATWTVTLPEKFARRVEDGSLVLWRPGLTMWIASFNNDRGEARDSRLAALTKGRSPASTEFREMNEGAVTRATYRLREDGVESLQVLMFSDSGHLSVSIYFDDERDAAVAARLGASFALRTK